MNKLHLWEANFSEAFVEHINNLRDFWKVNPTAFEYGTKIDNTIIIVKLANLLDKNEHLLEEAKKDVRYTRRELENCQEKLKKEKRKEYLYYHVEKVSYDIESVTRMKYYIMDGANEPVWFMGLYKTEVEALAAMNDYTRRKNAEANLAVKADLPYETEKIWCFRCKKLVKTYQSPVTHNYCCNECGLWVR